MRKIVVSMNLTLDGFMAGPSDELDWHFSYWNEEMAACAMEQLDAADTILLGRITYAAMAQYWPRATMQPGFPREDICFAEMMNNYTKVVFSGTLKKACWRNTLLVKKYSRDTVLKLKKQPGKNIILYGSASIVSALMQWELVDEYLLWVHPVALGRGKKMFAEVAEGLRLRLMHTRQFDTGVLLGYYQADTRQPAG